MTGFNLPNNYTANPEALLRKKWSRAASSSTTPPTHELVTPAPSATPIMPNTSNGNFELHTGLIMMGQAKQFSGL